MKKLKLLVFACLGIAVMICSGCNSNFKFPSQKDFELTVSISKAKLTVGDILEIQGIFKNLTKTAYKVESSATFSKSGLIHMNIFALDQPEGFAVGSTTFVNISENGVINEKQNITLKKSGKYKVVATSSFDISDPKTKEVNSYVIKSEPIIIEVK